MSLLHHILHINVATCGDYRRSWLRHDDNVREGRDCPRSVAATTCSNCCGRDNSPNLLVDFVALHVYTNSNERSERNIAISSLEGPRYRDMKVPCRLQP